MTNIVKHIQLFCLLLLVGLLSACAVTPQQTQETSLKMTEDNFYKQMLQFDRHINDQDLNKAEKLLTNLSNKAHTDAQLAVIAYGKARVAAQQNQLDRASGILNSSSTQQLLQSADNPTIIHISQFQAELLEKQQLYLDAARLRIYLAPLIQNDADYQKNHEQIWQDLTQLDSKNIDIPSFRNETELYAWLNLLAAAQQSETSFDQQILAISQWLNKHPQHPAAKNPPRDISLFFKISQERPKKIAVILPFDGKYRFYGQAIRDGLINIWHQSSYRPELTFYTTDENQGFIDSYQIAVADGAEMIIGPLFKEQLQELYQFDEVLPVTTIALNRLDKSQQIPPLNLYEFSLSGEDEIDSLLHYAQRQNFNQIAIIYQNDAWAEKLSDYLQQQWQELGKTVLVRTHFNGTREQSQLVQTMLQLDKSRQRSVELQRLTGMSFEFEPRRRQDIDAIFVISRPEGAASLRPMLSFHMAADIPVLATSSIYRGYANPVIDNDLSGIVFSEAPLLSEKSQTLSSAYQQSPYIRMYAMGMDAFLLAERIQLLSQLSQASLQGANGTLTLDHQTIKRQTAYARFVRGKIQAVELPTLMDEAIYGQEKQP